MHFVPDKASFAFGNILIGPKSEAYDGIFGWGSCLILPRRTNGGALYNSVLQV
jgi:hypothetical protein